MDIRKYEPVKHSTTVEIKTVVRRHDFLIEEFSNRQALDWIFAPVNSVQNSTVQTVPAWTVFNYLISPDDPRGCPDKIVYLLSINKYLTEIGRINKVLHLVKVKSDALHLVEVDLVLDRAICCNVFKIISSPVNSSFKSTIISLGMGVLHAECILVSIISKRFFVVGLKDLVIEAQLLEEESTISALSSPHHNNAIRIHKLAYETFIR